MARSIDLQGTDVKNLTFALSKASYIEGMVVDQNDQPIANATVQLYHYRHKPSQSIVHTTGDGCFKLVGVYPDQNYTISCSAQGYVPVMRDWL